MWKIINKNISDIANWLELIGFIATVFITIKVWFINRDVAKIKARHLLQVRLDQHIKDLKNSSKKIIELTSSFQTNTKQIKTEISICLEHCESLRKKTEKSDLRNLRPLIKKMKKVKRTKINLRDKKWYHIAFFNNTMMEEDVTNVYMDLTALLTEIDNFNRDQTKGI
jgi:hypothetical protein